MNQKQIKATQERIGTDVDGFWGPNSTAAAKRHLSRLMQDSAHIFPSQGIVRRNRSIFGSNGVPDGYAPPSKTIRLPFALHLYGDESNKVRTLQPHEACADSLLAVFHELAEVYPDKQSRKKAGILDYYGIYNPRSTRGGSVWSMHAYKIAIDLDANRNKNRSHWPIASSMPLEVMECFAKQGWLAAGAFWSRDGMHFQATSK